MNVNVFKGRSAPRLRRGGRTFLSYEERGEIDPVQQTTYAALAAAEVAAILCDPAGRILFATQPAHELLAGAGTIEKETQLLETLSGLSTVHPTARSLAAEAQNGTAHIPLIDDGTIDVRIRLLPGRLRLWLMRHDPARSDPERRRELFGIASHDLRSPLANIRSYAGMIQAGRGAPLDPRVKRAAQVIAKNADRGLRGVDELIDLYRSDERQLTLDRRNVPLDELLRFAFEEARPAAVDKGVQLGWRVSEGLPNAFVDEQLLRGAVRALLEAALRRTPPGGELRLTAEARPDELFIGVEDDGVRPDVREAALAFDREHQILKSKKLAAGVSLALAKSVAHAHGGRVGCVPRAGAGALFYLVLPRD